MKDTETKPTRPLNWSDELARAHRDRSLMPSANQAGIGLENGSTWSESDFPIVVPAGFLDRADWSDPSDPILMQVIPDPREQDQAVGFVRDPVDDRSARRAPGLLHKYHGRALLLVSGTCAVHCRYCFRRHYPYADEPKSLAELEPALSVLEEDVSLREVILSGGDPLSRTDAWLRSLVERLAAIDHLSVLRVHTRFPVAIPSRVTEGLIDLLTGTRLTPVVVMHVNHAREISPEFESAVRRLCAARVVVLNQSVLLAGVNDDADVLEELSRRLLAVGILPYYLHQLDPVEGASHFAVPVERGLQLIEQLRQRLPGYLVPRYVRETPGAPYKSVLDSHSS